MRLKKAKKYVEKVLPVLVEHIRENYHADFKIPEIEFDNSWTFNNDWGLYGYDESYNGKIILTRESRICLMSLVHGLTHELGHALLDQINPEFCYVDFENGDCFCLDEGVAEIIEAEGVQVLQEEGLYSPSILGNLRLLLNWYLNPHHWKNKFAKTTLPYDQGEKSVKQLRKEGMSLEDIMKQAHDPEFAHSIPYSCKPIFDKNCDIGRWIKNNRANT